MMEASRQIQRQPAWLMLASEFGESTLNEKGSGEFDPTFVITKLGAKVNRIIVSGLVERLELRETSNGSQMYQGQLRDPSGLHYFSVGEYATESMREFVVQLLDKVDSGEPVLLSMTAKARWYQTDEGAVYTSLRPEEAAVVSRDRYASWLVRACVATLERLDQHQKSLNCEPTKEAMLKEGIRPEMVDGLLSAQTHYGQIDTEGYRLNVMQALDIAEGKMAAATTAPPTLNLSEPQAEDGTDATEGEDLHAVILECIQAMDNGEGVDFESLVRNLAARGFTREQSEAELDSMSDDGVLHEPRFGWFKIVA
jgi:RPA family protein